PPGLRRDERSCRADHIAPLGVVEPDLATGVPDRVPIALPVYAVEVLAGDGLVAPVVRAVGAAGVEAGVVEQRLVEARLRAQVHEVRRLWRLKRSAALAVAHPRLVALEVRGDSHDVAAARSRPDRIADKLHVPRPVPDRTGVPVHPGDQVGVRSGNVIVARSEEHTSEL